MSDDNWRDSLKPGDRVVVAQGYYGLWFDTVERVTKSQVVLAGQPHKYWRESGVQVGTVIGLARQIVEPTAERVESIERREAIEAIKQLASRVTNDIPLKAIKAAIALLTPAKPTP